LQIFVIPVAKDYGLRIMATSQAEAERIATQLLMNSGDSFIRNEDQGNP